MQESVKYYKIPDEFVGEIVLLPDRQAEKKLLLRKLASPMGALKTIITLGVVYLIAFRMLPALKPAMGAGVSWAILIILAGLQIAYLLSPKSRPVTAKKNGIETLPWKAMHLISLTGGKTPGILCFHSVMQGQNIELNTALYNSTGKITEKLVAIAEAEAMEESSRRRSEFQYADALILRPDLHANYYAHQAGLALNAHNTGKCGPHLEKALAIDPRNRQALRVKAGIQPS